MESMTAMKFFTIQNSKIIDNIKNEDYYPDFTYSEFPSISNNIDLIFLYHELLTCFNMVNQSEYKGLVFAFIGDSLQNPLEDINEFVSFINKNYQVVGSYILALKGHEKDYSVAELEYDENEFNPFFIDYNDWQFLMPPFDSNSKTKIEIIFQSIIDNDYRPLILPSFLQAHVPYIKKANLINSCPFTSIASKLNWKSMQEYHLKK